MKGSAPVTVTAAVVTTLPVAKNISQQRKYVNSRLERPGNCGNTGMINDKERKVQVEEWHEKSMAKCY